jgi:hypothetical protein
MVDELENNGTPGNLGGCYANYLKVGHNAFEFVFDFEQNYADLGGLRRQARILTAPAYAKEFLDTIKKAVDCYERAFGAIEVVDGENDEQNDGDG